MNHPTDHRRFRTVLAFGVAALTAPILVLWAWNIALPEIFGAPTIDYRNALGLMILAIVVTIPIYGRTAIRRRGVQPGSGDPR